MDTLYCDPSVGRQVAFVFGHCPGEVLRQTVLEAPRAEALLHAIHNLLAGAKVEQLVLVNQASSFTLIRVLVTLYNTLAYSQRIPLYELSEPVEWSTLAAQLQTSQPLLKPQYSGQPNITYAAQPS